MNEPTHAPGWRGRPRRVGPIVSGNDVPRWLVALERIAPIGCAAIAAATLAIAAYAWAADGFAGFIQ